MTHSDRKEFAKIMMALAENFGSSLSAEGLELRFIALKKYSLEQIRQAALSILKTRKYLKMPTVAEFIELIEGRVEDVAQVEAMKVIEAVVKHGKYCSVVFDNPVTQAVIKYKFGGWIQLTRNLKEKNETWFIKDFVDTYIVFSRQNIKLDGYLPGIIQTEEPVFIGDAEKAKKVYLTRGNDRIFGVLESIKHKKQLMERKNEADKNNIAHKSHRETKTTIHDNR